MIVAKLSEIAKCLDARLNGADTEFRGVSADSRHIEQGQCFVALRGPHFDGHDFAAQALEQGAKALLVSRALDLPAPQLVVPDAQIALGQLAQWWRARLSAKVVAITGSNGKTTLKTLIAKILSSVGICEATEGNFNNEIGVPLTLLKMSPATQYAVVEMGAGQPGDIAYLAQLVKPDVAIVNNIAPAHLERMLSVQGVAETKGAVYQALPKNGCAVINADDDFANFFHRIGNAARIITFGLDSPADVGATNLRLDDAHARFDLRSPRGSVAIELPLPGKHNVRNALGAAALALALDVAPEKIARALKDIKPLHGRLHWHRLNRRTILIDDTYNANPASTKAAIDSLCLIPGERWLVLGNMAELGEEAGTWHAEIGDYAKNSGVTRLLTVGELAQKASERFAGTARHFADKASLVDMLRGEPIDADAILVKGSRSSGMEEVVKGLLDAERARGGTHAA